MKHKRKQPHHPPYSELIFIRCGQFVIVECGNGKVWLQKQNGEGMETSEAKFEKVIARFFKEEF